MYFWTVNYQLNFFILWTYSLVVFYVCMLSLNCGCLCYYRCSVLLFTCTQLNTQHKPHTRWKLATIKVQSILELETMTNEQFSWADLGSNTVLFGRSVLVWVFFITADLGINRKSIISIVPYKISSGSTILFLSVCWGVVMQVLEYRRAWNTYMW